MAKDKEASASSGKTNRITKFIGTKTLYLIFFILITMLIAYLSESLYLIKTDEYKDRVYNNINQQVLNQFNIMLTEKLNTSLLVASSLSKDPNIKKALISNNANNINMERLLEDMQTKKEYVDIQAELIDADGISFKRSWTYLAGDDLAQNDLMLAHLIKYPKVSSTIESTKYGMTISNKIPIMKNNTFIGFFGVNIHFDALVDIFAKNGFKTVIILNKKDSRAISNDHSYSRKFVDDFYVVNSNTDNYFLRLLKESNIETFFEEWENDYLVHEQSDQLISRYTIMDSENLPKAKVFIFKSIDEIDFGDLEFLQKIHIIATIIFIIAIAFLVNFFFILRRSKELRIDNEELTVVNEDLKTKTNDMDFNDKKLENMFNMQPNLMMMHNGKDITKANKRFMGFFNRFGTFEGFKKQHKCVSELFEKYEAPNYIWEQHIEGDFWIDYILKNPRRLYKIVMSIKNRQGIIEPHHFIIKLNEMDYAKHVAERLIIIALVDMTQDLPNYKVLEQNNTVEDKENIIPEKIEVSKEVKNDEVADLTSIQDIILKDKKIEKEKKVEEKVEEKKEEVLKMIPILDPFELIEKSTVEIFKEKLSSNIKSTEIKIADISKIVGLNCIEFDNEFKQIDQDKNFKWSLVISAVDLSMIFNIKKDKKNGKIATTINNSLKAVAKELVSSIGDMVQFKTNNKIELLTTEISIRNKMIFNYGTKVHSISLTLDDKTFDIYIVLSKEED